MSERKLPIVIIGVLVLFGLLSFAPFMVHSNHLYGGDWNDYFLPLTYFVRSAVVGYKTFPFHNPWRCGGTDMLINPQGRIFSPVGLFDIVLSPQWACIASLLVFGIIGLFGAYALLRHLRCSPMASVLGAVLFINCGWFSLHFATGHITFGEIQLLPLIFLAGLRFRERSFQFLAASLLTLMLLDGAIHALIYGIYGLLCGWIVAFRKERESPVGVTRIDWKYLARLGLVMALLAAIKIIPVAISIQGRSPMIDEYWMPAGFLFQALLDPRQSLYTPPPPSSDYVFHEFGCYLGWGALALFLVAVASRSTRRESRAHLAMFLFWLWVASGFATKINPWSILQRLPVLNQAHLQSRTFVLMMLFFMILVAKGLDLIRHRRLLWGAAILLCLVESFAVRFHATEILGTGPTTALTRADLIQNDNLKETVFDGTTLEYLQRKNVGAVNCNDRSYYASSVKQVGVPEYRGEIFVSEGRAKASLESVLPGEIRVKYSAATESAIAVNNNYLWGWKSNDPRVKIISAGFGDLLRIRVPAGAEGVVTLKYSPLYLLPSLLLSLIGCILYLMELQKLRLRSAGS